MNDSGNNNGMIATDVLAPTRVIAGKYRLGKILGEGGMGAVYEAEHRELGNKVAVKLLSEQSINNPNSLARFRREAKVMGQIHHENVIAVMDAGTDDAGVPFLVMELLDGEPLAATLRRERVLSPGLSAWIINETLSGLGAAHAKNVVHRDLKPGNVFISTQSDGSRRVKLLDFGISKLGDSSATLNVTAQGALVGTPNFMAPEQIRATEELDGRVDIYAAGIMLYRMVTGKLPYVGANAEELYRNILMASPTPPTQIRPELGAALESVIFKAMHPEREQRFQSPYEFQAALQEALPEESYSAIRQKSSVRPVSLGPDQSLGSQRSGQDSTLNLPIVGTPATRPSKPELEQGIPPQVAHAQAMHVPMTDVPTHKKSGQWIAGIVIVLFAVIGGVVTYSITRENNRAESPEAVATPAPGGTPVYFGIARHKDPEKIKSELRPLTDYLASRIDRPVELKIIDNYDDFASPLASGELQMVAMSAANYVRTKRELPGLTLLATPTTDSGPTYGAYILSRADSGISTLADLKDKTFCYTSETSSSGYIYPRAVFRQAGMNPDIDLRSRFTSDHPESLRTLQKGGCDGAAVYDKAWLESEDPAAFTVVKSTERVPWDAYCASESLDADTRATLAKALTDLELGSPLAQEVLGANNAFSGFLPADDSLYDPVRSLEKYLNLENQQDAQ